MRCEGGHRGECELEFLVHAPMHRRQDGIVRSEIPSNANVRAITFASS
jgi:hypothetical protein